MSKSGRMAGTEGGTGTDFGVETDAMTLNRFLLAEQQKIPGATGDFTNLINSLLTAIKAISNAVRKAGLQAL